MNETYYLIDCIGPKLQEKYSVENGCYKNYFPGLISLRIF
ncbi:hypothetical protein CEV31_2318 [Brucella thiophenivorans]|uniref:Uncharacterized protein n=1 Tax=Brucella thiophenivorans TaxID=571255 RepID=A0A256FW64_9HYPH|nr:hypothetical protein CEV31_2318 [Brucella thiophenivorans]